MKIYYVKHSPSSEPALLVAGEPHQIRGDKSFAKECDKDARQVIEFMRHNLCGATLERIGKLLKTEYKLG